MRLNLFKTAITCRWGKFIGDALLDSASSLDFQPTLESNAKMSLLLGVNNQISASNQQVFPTVNPIDAVNWADQSGRIGLCTVSAIRDEGILLMSQQSITVTGVANFTATFTVPEGKRWIIKEITAVGVGGTGCTGQYGMYYTDLATHSLTIAQSAAGVWATLLAYTPSIMLSLPAGWVITVQDVGATWTTNGSFVATVLYQECDA